MVATNVLKQNTNSNQMIQIKCYVGVDNFISLNCKSLSEIIIISKIRLKKKNKIKKNCEKVTFIKIISIITCSFGVNANRLQI